MDAYESLLTRRSIRKYKDLPMAKEDLQRIAEAGLYAATGHDKQNTMMVIVDDLKTIEELEKYNASVLGKPEMHTFYGAPALIIVFADGEVSNCRYDGALCMGNLMQAAHALGFGACWINRAREVFASEAGEAYKRAWGVPDHYEGVGNLIVGYADEQPVASERKAGRIIYADKEHQHEN